MPRKSSKAAAEEDIYEIKSILEYEQRKNTDYYLVEWDGYPIEEATWEPRSNFFNPSADVLRRMQELKEAYFQQGSGRQDKAVNGKQPSLPATTNDESGQSGSEGRAAAKRKHSRTEPNSATTKRRLKTLKGTATAAAVTAEDGQPAASEQSSTNRKLGRSKSRQRSGSVDGGGGVNQEDVNSAEAQKDSSPSTIVEPSSKRSAKRQASIRSRSPNATSPNKRQSSRSRSPIPRNDGTEETTTRVKSIRQDPVHGLCVVLTITGPDGEVEDQRRPVAEVRAEYPDQLIEFLLQRIQFRVSPSKNAGAQHTANSTNESV